VTSASSSGWRFLTVIAGFAFVVPPSKLVGATWGRKCMVLKAMLRVFDERMGFRQSHKEYSKTTVYQRLILRILAIWSTSGSFFSPEMPPFPNLGPVFGQRDVSMGYLPTSL